MLATALANSGSTQFQADDNELMIRALRNLSPSDIKTLDHEYLRGWLPVTKRIDYAHDILSSLSRLASSGLVIETFHRPDPNASDEQKLHSLLAFAPKRTFQLSDFGRRFIQFISAQDSKQES